jgi:hypothetical protein
MGRGPAIEEAAAVEVVARGALVARPRESPAHPGDEHCEGDEQSDEAQCDPSNPAVAKHRAHDTARVTVVLCGRAEGAGECDFRTPA